MGHGGSHAIADTQELERLVSDWDETAPMLAQPLLRGAEGWFGLVLDGRVVCWSGHRRLRMMNPADRQIEDRFNREALGRS